MKTNMGSLDRLVRVVLAIAVGVLILTSVLSGVWAWILGALAVIFLITSAIGLCPLYLPFGLSTCKPKEAAIEKKTPEPEVPAEEEPGPSGS
jgi:hypothetical protein